VFKKYFSEIDTFTGEYDGLTKILDNGYKAMEEDVNAKENKVE